MIRSKIADIAARIVKATGAGLLGEIASP